MAIIVNRAGLVSDLMMDVKADPAAEGLIDGRAEPQKRIVLLKRESVSLAILPA